MKFLGGGQMLTIQIQNNTPCIWVLVNPENVKEKVKVKIRTIGTGYPIKENFNGKYIGTFQLSGGALVFHVFVI